jgi:hypothetical protein
MANRTIARCKRCPQTPPWGFCPDCAAINKHRQQVGLLKGAADPRPSLCNALVPIVVGKYRGARHRHIPNGPRMPVITACVEKKRGGWRYGLAMLDGQEIYRSKPMRDVQQALAWATTRADMIRVGLNYEQDEVGIVRMG